MVERRVVTKALWLFMWRNRHKQWSTKELRLALVMESSQVSSALIFMQRQGQVERHGKPRDLLYAVTDRCVIPFGLTIKEVVEAQANNGTL